MKTGEGGRPSPSRLRGMIGSPSSSSLYSARTRWGDGGGGALLTEKNPDNGLEGDGLGD